MDSTVAIISIYNIYVFKSAFLSAFSLRLLYQSFLSRSMGNVENPHSGAKFLEFIDGGDTIVRQFQGSCYNLLLTYDDSLSIKLTSWEELTVSR